MATFLFTWNPAHWNWPSLHEQIAHLRQDGRCRERWGCATKQIRPGDRAFLMKVGAEPRGLMGSGWAAGEAYQDLHWRADQQAQGRLTRYVEVDWDTLLDPDTHIFPRAWLASPLYAAVRWEARASGLKLPDPAAEQLERDWATFLAQLNGKR